jgi:hypothetical protein
MYKQYLTTRREVMDYGKLSDIHLAYVYCGYPRRDRSKNFRSVSISAGSWQHCHRVYPCYSLVNDASALVLYKLTIAAVLSGIFSFSDASVAFVKMVSGGIVIGLFLSYVLQNFSRRFLEPTVGAVFSFTIPYTLMVENSL